MLLQQQQPLPLRHCCQPQTILASLLCHHWPRSWRLEQRSLAWRLRQIPLLLMLMHSSWQLLLQLHSQQQQQQLLPPWLRLPHLMLPPTLGL